MFLWFKESNCSEVRAKCNKLQCLGNGIDHVSSNYFFISMLLKARPFIHTHISYGIVATIFLKLSYSTLILNSNIRVVFIASGAFQFPGSFERPKILTECLPNKQIWHRPHVTSLFISQYSFIFNGQHFFKLLVPTELKFSFINLIQIYFKSCMNQLK